MLLTPIQNAVLGKEPGAVFVLPKPQSQRMANFRLFVLFCLTVAFTLRTSKRMAERQPVGWDTCEYAI